MKAGYEGKEEQFYFQFLISFTDNEKWLVQSTTSIRDRINIQQWHSLNLKNIIDEITKSIIVYPDITKDNEVATAVRYNDRIKNQKIYSAIDYVIKLSDLSQMIESKYLSTKSIGQKKALEGDNLELLLVEILNNKNNLEKWNNNNDYGTGFYYHYFCKILNSVGVEEDSEIIEIEASRDIPSLPSGGKPKTDLYLKVKLNTESFKTYTFSCKRSSSNWVTVHQYSVNKFIEVLGITNNSLQEALIEFQKVGGKTALSSGSFEILQAGMTYYKEQLAKWVYGGFNGEGDPEVQWAKYIVTFKNDTAELSIMKLEDYIDIIIDDKGHFGTPFKWTFASGSKGKSIQLKGRVV